MTIFRASLKRKVIRIRQNKSELRISIPSIIFRDCFMLSFPPLSHTFNNLRCYACGFLCKNFFTYHRWQDLFLDKFLLQEFFWGNYHLACEPQTHFRSSLLSLRKIASANPSDKTISVT